MSTGNAEYNAEVFIAQGSTRFENYGHSRYGTRHLYQHYASTYSVDGSTIVLAARAVTNSSTNVSFTLPSPKLNAEMRIWVVGATSSGIHSFLAPSGVTIKGTPGTTEGNEITVQNSGFVDLFAPTTLLWIAAGSGNGSSDFAVTS